MFVLGIGKRQQLLKEVVDQNNHLIYLKVGINLSLIM